MKTFEDRLARGLREFGTVTVQWDSFGQQWSVWQPRALGVTPLFLEIGPRAYNSTNWLEGA